MSQGTKQLKQWYQVLRYPHMVAAGNYFVITMESAGLRCELAEYVEILRTMWVNRAGWSPLMVIPL